MLDLSALPTLGSRDDDIGRLTDRELAAMFRFLLRARMGATVVALTIAALLATYDQTPWKIALAGGVATMLLLLTLRDRPHFHAQWLPPRKSTEILGSVMVVHATLITLTGGIHSPLVVLFPPITFLFGAVVGRPRVVWIPLVLSIVFVWGLAADDLFPAPRLVPEVFAEVLPRLGGPAFAITMAVVLSMVMMATTTFGLLLRGAVERAVRGAQEARAETLATMQDRNRELWRLSGAVAHELKNPLASVQGLASLLARRFEAGTKESQRMGVLVEEVERMGSIIEEFLNFSRPLTEMTRRETSTTELVERAVALHRPLAEASGVTLHAEIGREGSLACDPRKLAQVLGNLLHNGIDASPRGGQVRLRVRDADDERVCFEVLDDGPGIDPEIRPLLFRPGSTTKPSGSGIGLTVARAIAEQHGGTLELLDRPEGGCRAVLTVPREPVPSSPETS
ncbi:MAG: HAMP domain-containing histidine kinase [Myxococcales bacterium]|nr:HAMP domain-containing histidine kinase [Myxococcales bacterium]